MGSYLTPCLSCWTADEGDCASLRDLNVSIADLSLPTEQDRSSVPVSMNKRATPVKALVEAISSYRLHYSTLSHSYDIKTNCSHTCTPSKLSAIPSAEPRGTLTFPMLHRDVDLLPTYAVSFKLSHKNNVRDIILGHLRSLKHSKLHLIKTHEGIPRSLSRQRKKIHSHPHLFYLHLQPILKSPLPLCNISPVPHTSLPAASNPTSRGYVVRKLGGSDELD